MLVIIFFSFVLYFTPITDALANDLALFFVTSTTTELREAHLQPLLKRYHVKLSQVKKERNEIHINIFFLFHNRSKSFIYIFVPLV